MDFGTATTFDCVTGDAFLGAHLPGSAIGFPSPESGYGQFTPANFGVALWGPAHRAEHHGQHELGPAFWCRSPGGGPDSEAGRGHLGYGRTGRASFQACPVIQAVVPDLLAEGLARIYFEPM